jgi:hypothetical protein
MTERREAEQFMVDFWAWMKENVPDALLSRFDDALAVLNCHPLCRVGEPEKDENSKESLQNAFHRQKVYFSKINDPEEWPSFPNEEAGQEAVIIKLYPPTKPGGEHILAHFPQINDLEGWFSVPEEFILPGTPFSPRRH